MFVCRCLLCQHLCVSIARIITCACPIAAQATMRVPHSVCCSFARLPSALPCQDKLCVCWNMNIMSAIDFLIQELNSEHGSVGPSDVLMCSLFFFFFLVLAVSYFFFKMNFIPFVLIPLRMNVSY